MAFVVRFTPQGMSAEKYNEVLHQLEMAGAGSPAGRLFHVSFGDHDNLQVSDIWDSMENFQSFGTKLMPILADLGIDPGTPDFIEVYKTISG